MPRIARVVGIGLTHHITQRGNYQQKIFLNHADKKQYLAWIEEYSKKFSLTIVAYCLMDNHVHFIAIPEKEDSLARTFNTSHMRYSQYFNKKIDKTGHLWQGRFNSCVLDEKHFICAVKYVERNPVRAKIVVKPWDWEWSSARAHIGEGESIVTLKDIFELIDIPKNSWEEYIEEKEDENIVTNIKKYTLTGRPLGSDLFIKRLEEKFGRRLMALSRGRPKEQ